MTQPTSTSAFWQASISELYRSLDASPAGLTTAQADMRFAQYGPNTPSLHHERALILQFLSRFRNPLVLLLLAASAVSAVTGDQTSFFIITFMVLMSVTLDFIQEHRAGKAAEGLKASVAVHASVLRDGKPQETPVAKIVPGDVVALVAGDLVPADCVVLEAKDFFINQALLTGEPYPVEKRTGVVPASDMSSATHAVFMGTSVISGNARVLVCRTGPATALGEIADSLTTNGTPTSFERGTRQFGLLIMRLTILLVLFVLLVNSLFHRPWLETFLFAVALAVGLTPELLPMVVSVTLSRGAIRMSRQQVIVKRLSSIQDLGSMDVLCTDKTGTLTEARIRLERHVNPSGVESERVLQLAYLNSFFESGLRSPLDDAILAHQEIDISAWHKIDEVQFDFERRRISVLVESDGQRLLVVKGAPEDILRLSTHYEGDSAEDLRPLDGDALTRVQTLNDDLAREGFRVLGIAWRKVAADHPHAVVDDETELVFAGFAAFLDPPKASAGPALQALTASGIAVKIVTGDNELVTRHICTQLGVEITGVLTGNDLQLLNDEALWAKLDNVNLFCRVNPAQKNRIIQALQARRHVVGYLGDGINDAPALKSADIGISVDSAVDVAKDAADMIMLKSDLQVLHDGVREGRRTFGNIMKYIMMGTSSSFGNMFSMAGATVLLPFLPMLPVQILLNNLMYDLSEVAIPMDKVDDDYLATPRQWNMNFIRNFMLTIGPVSSVFDFLTFYIMLSVFSAGEALFRTGWFIESIASQVLVIFIIRTRHNPLQSQPSRLLILASLAVIACAIILPYLPLGHWFGFVPLPLEFFAFLIAMVVCYLIAVEVVKRWFYCQHGKAFTR
ncbi:MAG: magnesium-translocating P-type ATPase [Gammaproteobacteria bacterium]|nr:magnesium-translocating P-type ATPase [Gammaproteobacteria bacterium]